MNALAIRVAQPEDGPAVSSIYAHYVRETAASFETDPPGGEVMSSRISDVLPTYPYLVALREGGVVGFAYAGQHRARPAYRWSVDVTIYVAPTATRTGIGRALYTPLLDVLRLQGFHSAFAGITLPNPGSVALHEAFGFERIGLYKNVGYKHGAWRSVEWWGFEISDSDSPPVEFIPFASHEVRSHLAAIGLVG